jgi:hypothetical protein
VNIRDKRTGVTKLETRIPAGFIGGVTALIPQVRRGCLVVSANLCMLRSVCYDVGLCQ